MAAVDGTEIRDIDAHGAHGCIVFRSEGVDRLGIGPQVGQPHQLFHRSRRALLGVEALPLHHHKGDQRAEQGCVLRVLPGVFDAEEALHLPLPDQGEGREIPGPLFLFPAVQVDGLLPAEKHRCALLHTFFKQREAFHLCAGNHLLDAALARAGPLKGHHQRVPVFHQHHRVDPVGAIILADGPQNALEGRVQRPGGEHDGNAVQRHVLFRF